MAAKKKAKAKVKAKVKAKALPTKRKIAPRGKAKKFSLRRPPRKEDLPDTVSRDAEEALIEDDGLDIPSDKALAQIASLAEQQLAAEKKLEDAEKAKKDAEKALARIQDDLLPEAMREAGCTEFTLANGMKIKVKPELSCSIDKQGENRERALSWLESHHLGGIIKREISVRFGKDELDKAEQLLKTLDKMKLVAETSESVHGSTLKATLREVMQKGIVPPGKKKPKKIDVPLEFFNGHPYSRATIK